MSIDKSPVAGERAGAATPARSHSLIGALPARVESRRPWWRMGKIDPGEFAMLRVSEAADVIWNLCSAHGDLVGILAAVEARRQSEVERVVSALLADLDAA